MHQFVIAIMFASGLHCLATLALMSWAICIWRTGYVIHSPFVQLFACWQAWTCLSWQLEHDIRWAGQLEHGTLSWPTWTWYVELANLNMVRWAGQLEYGTLSWPTWTWYVELASLNMVRWAGQLEQCCWQACSCMLEQTVHDLLNEQTWTTLLEPSR